MPRYAIRIITDPSAPDDGPYVRFYNPAGHGGWGALTTTTTAEDALVFPTQLAALECYGQVPANRPVRPDGRPNKPLTAFMVSIDNLDTAS
jgi:hypothetical protein